MFGRFCRTVSATSVAESTMLAIFFEIDRLQELVGIGQRRVETLGRIVEMRCQSRPVAHQDLEILRTRRKRLAHRLRIADDSANLVWVDRLDHAVGVLSQTLDLSHYWLNGLADLGQVLERRVDIGGVGGQGLREGVGALKGRMD